MTNSHGDQGFGPGPREETDDDYDRRREEDADQLAYQMANANLAGLADREYLPRIEASRVTLEFAQRSARRLDAGEQSIEDSPLFGGWRQGRLFA